MESLRIILISYGNSKKWELIDNKYPLVPYELVKVVASFVSF